MLLEMHAHTSEHSSCSTVSAEQLIRQVFAKGLQGIVLTDHHYLWSDEELLTVRRAAQVPDHFLIMAGQEVCTADFGDVLVYGAKETLPRGISLLELRSACPEAALVWAHPYRQSRPPLKERLLNALLDGVEIFNSNHSVRQNSLGLQDWHRHRFTAIAGTDTHGLSYAGLYPTQFDHPIADIYDLALEIKRGRCRPFFKEIPRSGANSRVTEITIGTKGADDFRERIIIRNLETRHKWRAAERAHGIMKALVEQGFGDGLFRIPKPIDADTGTMTLIEQGVRGRSLYDKLLSASEREGRQCLELAARWLAAFHNCRLAVTPSREFLEKEQTRLDKYVERFTAIRHRHLQRATEIMESVYQYELALLHENPRILVQGHGDFHPKNIIIGQDNQENLETRFVAAIDFESSFMLPRAFDVGCFVAQFSNQFHPHRELLKALPEEIFLGAYCEAAEGLDGDFPRQVELFRARTNLSIASYLIKVGLGDSEDLWRVLLEAERSICLL